MPMIEDYLEVSSIEDLTPAIELYHALIEQSEYDTAFEIFRDKLDHATRFKLGTRTLSIDLLERLFPEGTQILPKVSNPKAQNYILNSLELAYDLNGHPSKSLDHY